MEEVSDISPARRQSNIRNILEQVKSGQKNKTEAFHELRSILNSSLTRTMDADGDRIPGPEREQEQAEDVGEVNNVGPPTDQAPTGIFSHEDRRAFLNKLIEKQIRGGNDEVMMDPSGQEDDGNDLSQPHRSTSPNSSISGATRSLTGTQRHASRGQAANIRYNVDPNIPYEQDGRYDEENNMGMGGSVSGSRSGYSTSGYDVRGVRGYEEEGDYTGYEPQYSMSDMYFGDARSNRMVRHEASIREEMFRECTFRPRIKELPLGLYGISKDSRSSRDGPFYDRVMRWKETVEQNSTVKKQQVDRSSSIDCTFHPRMNRNSERAVREIRSHGYDDAMSVGERLYRNSEAVYMMRARAIEDELKRERKKEDRQCTFQPQLVTKKFTQVKSKFHLPPKKADSSVLEERIMKTCTFTPKVSEHNIRLLYI
jgi:hypothetical protein